MPSSSESASPELRPTTSEPRPATRPGSRSGSYALTIFLSAFLLFQVQPLVAKEILPWFGGSAAVWTTCMLFFQLALLAGYGYAHWVTTGSAGSRAQWIHRALLIVSVLVLPIIPLDSWKPADGSIPLWRILGLLTITVGGPYFLLASTSPLLQTWYGRTHANGVPYRFFALSNLGSMLALISYPFVIEPRTALRNQAWIWSASYVIFAILCFWLAKDSTAPLPMTEASVSDADPGWSVRISWMLLAACASGLLLAVTNHITQNIAAIPFFWVLPLSLYLLSFILTFESSRWYSRRLFLGLFAVAVGSMGYAVAKQVQIRDLRVLLPMFAIGLFVCCMVCHGELVRRKPAHQFLTSFYLMIAVGGAIGGLFVAAFAPAVFPALFEFPILLIVTPIVILWVTRGDAFKSESVSEWDRAQSRSIWVAASVATIALAVYLAKEQVVYLSDASLLARNFYGALRVTDDDDLGLRELAHGTINHGEQFLDPVRRRQPITYYAPATGIGLLMTDLQKRGALRVGVVGLGTGTMAAWGRAGDTIRFYEINPLVLKLARSEFSYLRDSPAKVDVVLGDARLSMEKEQTQQFDVLAIDAFSGDSIPIHLLTREAFRIYWKHLRPNGVLAIHTSNKYLDLSPPVELLAKETGREAHLIESLKDEKTRTFASDWVLVGANEVKRFPWMDDADSPIDDKPGLRPWTDDFSNLWQILQ
jgi:SAM-dependent methyltransferase